MPHKRNPVLTENLTGLARVVRAAVVPAMENVALWHERDISHSSVERFIGPDACITLDFALARLTGVIDKLLVYPERMQKQHRPHGRADPFAARAARADPGRAQPRGQLCPGPAQRDEGVGERRRSCRCSTCSRPTPRSPTRLSDAELEELFDLDYHFRRIDMIFDRVFAGLSAHAMLRAATRAAHDRVDAAVFAATTSPTAADYRRFLARAGGGLPAGRAGARRRRRRDLVRRLGRAPPRRLASSPTSPTSASRVPTPHRRRPSPTPARVARRRLCPRRIAAWRRDAAHGRSDRDLPRRFLVAPTARRATGAPFSRCLNNVLRFARSARSKR